MTFSCFINFQKYDWNVILVLNTHLFYRSFELGDLKGEKLCFTLKISLGDVCLILSTLTLAVIWRLRLLEEGTQRPWNFTCNGPAQEFVSSEKQSRRPMKDWRE